MTANRILTSAALVLSSLVPAALAKDSKPILPAYVLRARTVAVVIDPEAGVSLGDPYANQTAQRDVEAALQQWGRFTTTISLQDADLVIVVRKGSGKLVDATASDPRQNGREGSITPTDNGISIGAQHGPQPPLSRTPSRGGTQNGPPYDNSSVHPQLEAGRPDDSFEVYEGKVDQPMDGAVAWRYIKKNALHSHDVPAVDEFRKALAEAEKQAAQQPKKHP